MKHGLLVANIGSYADPRVFVDVAQTAEAAGWDAVLIWAHLAFTWGMPAADPWVSLGAAAVSTERVLLGTGVTPVARRLSLTGISAPSMIRIGHSICV